ncbi:ornithine cyclodeaminase family protein [uncultured Ruegeria sp.]|uniref:ornithine cyclodeaminase family protein n=1 Tax=uncultured Ruegeria sp. TaxID=259304 RepID=UPI00260BD90B|nr:ornithine cyclodeaminase family protein [uncultured Ruegeria sp.]
MHIRSEEMIRHLAWPDLIEALRRQFKAGCEVPERHHHSMQVPGSPDATMLLMPAWQSGERIGVKLVNVFPSNTKVNLPSITADYLLYDGKTGQNLAMMDGAVITSRRTAAAAALGAKFLSRENSETLFLVGAGRVASLVPEAMRTVRPIKKVLVWDLYEESAHKLVDRLSSEGFEARVQLDLESGTRSADIISCATLSKEPLIRGAWLAPGQHLDLIGSFTPDMRETDDEAMRIASVYVDIDTALTESGDMIEPLRNGAITEADIKGDLAALCRETAVGRTKNSAITLFKAVGSALEDLAAASLIYDKGSIAKF